MLKLSLLPRIVVLLCASSLLTTQTALAGGFAIDVDENGIALRGHDPVAYFAEGRPTMGSGDYTAKAGGATYHFASAANREQFLADPAKYAPAYGGFCALGITRSMKVPGDPEAWKIVDGRLYINSSPQALAIWTEDIPGNISKADEAWPAIKDTDPAEL